jgi:hypothetical protein
LTPPDIVREAMFRQQWQAASFAKRVNILGNSSPTRHTTLVISTTTEG